MLTLVVAAAAAAAPVVSLTAVPAAVSDGDLRCMAAYLLAAGNMGGDPAASADDKAGVQSIVMYYFGKLTGQAPGRDIKGDVARLLQTPDYGMRLLKPDIERCSVEAMDRARYLESFGTEAPGAAAK